MRYSNLHLFIAILALVGCASDRPQAEKSSASFVEAERALGEEQTKLFTMSFEKARAAGLPEVAFAVKVPFNTEIRGPTNGDSYVEFVSRDESGAPKEFLTLGAAPSFYTVPDGWHQSGFDTKARNLERFRSATVKRTAISWSGLKLQGLQAKMVISMPSESIDGNVLWQEMLLPPPEGAENGLEIVMFAVDGNSLIRKFEDFEEKGMPAKLWSQFSWITSSDGD